MGGVSTAPPPFLVLDQLIKSAPVLKLRYTCNELNAGYAADGYARAKGIGCLVVTYTVGGLSALNAVAGAASERLPLIVVTGGPNSNDWGSNRVLHHTIGLPDFDQESRAFAPFVAKVTRIHTLEDAHWQLDDAIATALRDSMPVYINIACNIAGLPHATFEREPIPFSLPPKHSNAHSLQLAVDTALELLSTAVKPVLVGGVKLRPPACRAGFAALAAAMKCAVAVMPNAKGMVDETTERFMGVYWGQVSTPYCAETVEAADVAVFVGPIFNDYTTVGYSLLLKKEKTIIVEPDRVVIANRRYFQCIHMADFLDALAKRAPANETSWTNHQRMYVPAGALNKPAPDAPLVTKVAFQHIQQLVDATPTALVVETGDSWFNGLKLKLPSGTPYEFQCQFGSIGWSVGATLGAAAAYEGDDRRVVALIGDGSLQVRGQSRGGASTDFFKGAPAHAHRLFSPLSFFPTLSSTKDDRPRHFNHDAVQPGAGA